MSNLRPLSVSLAAKVDETVTLPGYLVALEFDSETVRLSSRGTLAWGGYTWIAFDLDVSGLSSDGAGDVSGELRLGNTDNTLSALVLGDGIAGRPVSIWMFYGDAPAADEATQVFAGMGDDAGLNLDRVAIKLISDSIARVLLPRGRITPAMGFNHLTPAGTVLTWNGEKITLGASNG